MTSAEQMLQHAQLHYFSAQKHLEHAENAENDDWAELCCQRALAEAQAGLLAISLAKRGVP